MKLNLSKCEFKVESRKFLGFMINQRGTEANPKKIKALPNIKLPTKLKEVLQLTEQVAILRGFISKAANQC